MDNKPIILIINAGSSSIKYGLYDADNLSRITKDKIEISSDDDYDKAFNSLLSIIEEENVIGVGHRIVHGGKEFSAPAILDTGVLSALENLIPLAPLHQPHNLKPISLIMDKYPEIKQIACFDTAFHRTQSPLSELYAIPKELSEKGMVRYGFHGSSYEYIASILEEQIGEEKAKGRVIIAHLGNGASMCALHNLKSVSTTMGFTPLDGLMMGTRCGDIDPGLPLYLIEQEEMSAQDVSYLLQKSSGLKGVSGISSDMRDLLESDEQGAQEAIELFCLYAARQAAMLTVDMGGLDALIFTAGIGTNSQIIREKIVSRLSHLGDFSVHVIPTNEELVMARHVKALL